MLLKNNNLHILFFDSTQHRIYLYFSELHRIRCCLPYKGTNFSANHNQKFVFRFSKKDVVYPTKVRIFQQITTVLQNYKQFSKMLFTLQRYEFFSKSQLSVITRVPSSRCCLPYKGTNFSANHNHLRLFFVCTLDVVYPTKVRIFQQITTARFVR